MTRPLAAIMLAAGVLMAAPIVSAQSLAGGEGLSADPVPPTMVKPPSVPWIFPVGQKLFHTVGNGQTWSAITVVMTWWATPGSAPIAYYRVQRSFNGNGFQDYYIPPSTATSLVIPDFSAGVYQFRVRAVAADGSVSEWATGPAFRYRLWQEKNAAIGYQGTWRKSTSTNWRYNEDAVRYTTQNGATASFKVSHAYTIAIVSTLGPTRGKVKATVDGVNQWFDTANAQTVYRQGVCIVVHDPLDQVARNHSIKLTNLVGRFDFDAVVAFTTP